MKKILLCLFFLFFFSGIATAHAQNDTQVFPTVYCLGSCPTAAVSEAPVNTPITSVSPSLPSSEMVTTTPTNEEISSTPTPSASASGANSNPGNAAICTNLSQFFATLSSSKLTADTKVHIKCASQKQEKSSQQNDGYNGGNLSKLIAQLLQLIAQLLQMCLTQSAPGASTPTLSPAETPIATLPVSLEPTTESTQSETTTSVLCKTIPSTSRIKPTATNTGVPAGVALTTTLPAGVQVNGDSWKVTTDGTVIDSKDIVDKLVDVEANNVTIRNSRIKAPDGSYWAINTGDNKTGLSVINSEVYTVNGAQTGILFGSNAKICGVNGHGFQHVAFGNGNHIILQANYFHVNLPAPGTIDPHNGDIDVRGGTDVKILGNNLTQTNADESWQHNTSALYLGATWGDIDQVVVDSNWFGGGTYSLYTVTVKGQVSPTPVLKTIDITNNKWYRSSYAYGPHATDDNTSWKAHTWSNNTFEDNGQIIPF